MASLIPQMDGMDPQAPFVEQRTCSVFTSGGGPTHHASAARRTSALTEVCVDGCAHVCVFKNTHVRGCTSSITGGMSLRTKYIAKLLKLRWSSDASGLFLSFQTDVRRAGGGGRETNPIRQGWSGVVI